MLFNVICKCNSLKHLNIEKIFQNYIDNVIIDNNKSIISNTIDINENKYSIYIYIYIYIYK